MSTAECPVHRSVRGALRTRLLDIAGTPGSRSAARAVRSADGRSESVGESRSRVILDRWKLQPSDLQFEVRTAEGGVVGRADFVWEGHRLVGEFDELREDAIREEGRGVVRWTWGDLHRPDRFSARVRRRTG